MFKKIISIVIIMAFLVTLKNSASVEEKYKASYQINPVSPVYDLLQNDYTPLLGDHTWSKRVLISPKIKFLDAPLFGAREVYQFIESNNESRGAIGRNSSRSITVKLCYDDSYKCSRSYKQFEPKKNEAVFNLLQKMYMTLNTKSHKDTGSVFLEYSIPDGSIELVESLKFPQSILQAIVLLTSPKIPGPASRPQHLKTQA